MLTNNSVPKTDQRCQQSSTFLLMSVQKRKKDSCCTKLSAAYLNDFYLGGGVMPTILVFSSLVSEKKSFKRIKSDPILLYFIIIILEFLLE